MCGDVNRRSSNRERERENEQTNERTKDRSSTHHMTQKTDWEKERERVSGRHWQTDRTGQASPRWWLRSNNKAAAEAASSSVTQREREETGEKERKKESRSAFSTSSDCSSSTGIRQAIIVQCPALFCFAYHVQYRTMDGVRGRTGRKGRRKPKPLL